MDELVLGEKLGHGWQKEVYGGQFRGTKVVVKVLIPSGKRVEFCLDEGHPVTYCHYYPYLVSLYEILLNEQLDHPAIIKPLGYCIRDVENPPEEEEPPLDRGVITVYEFGEKVRPYKISNFTEKLQLSLQFTEMLDYFEHSPIGSLYINDLHHANIVRINGQLKACDIEESWVSERRCGSGPDTKPCSFGVKCIDGECLGMNARHMMNRTNDYFFKLWLKNDSKNTQFQKELSEISMSLKDNTTTAAQLGTGIKAILNKM